MILLRWAGDNLGRAVWGEHRHCMVLALFLVLLPPAVSVRWGGRTPVSTENLSRQTLVPKKGIFLVATAGMQDPRFRYSVVLLLEHGEKGTLGLIVNKVTEISLAQVLPELEDSGQDSNLLFFGGPVGLDGLLFVTRSGEPPERAEHVMQDVYYSGDKGLLKELLRQNKSAGELRVFLGNSGWSPGQLAAEIAEGAWRLVRGDSETLFEKDPNDIWPDLNGPPAPSPSMVQRPHSTTVLPG
jgi:putative transcriptional regulator